ncbi:MAG: MmcQ/YjbR family DNA-binding protein [Candidatus Korobacteraceae bacterium]
MDIEAIRRHCLQFPHTTENVQWDYVLCFKLDGKLFVVTRLEPAPVRLSLKVSSQNFVELCERPGIRPAPYLARAKWIGLEQLNTLPDSELRELMAESYRLVWERLPKKRQEELQSGTKAGGRKAAPRKQAAKRKTAKKREPAAKRRTPAKSKLPVNARGAEAACKK